MNVRFVPLRATSPIEKVAPMGYEQEMESYEAEERTLPDSLQDSEPLLRGGVIIPQPEESSNVRRVVGLGLAGAVAALVVGSMVIALFTLHPTQERSQFQTLSSNTHESYLKASLPLLPLSHFAPPSRPLLSASDPFSHRATNWPGHAWLSQTRFSHPSQPPNITWPPSEYLQASYAFSAQNRPQDDLSKGVKFDPITGRPLQIPRSSLYLSPENWRPPTVRVSDLRHVVDFPKVQWKGFEQRREKDSEHEKQTQDRQAWVKRACLHAWEGYKKNAWGHDEVRPLSSSYGDPYNSWGATIIDSLDTLLIMNLSTEYAYAREHVKVVDFTFHFRESCFSTELPVSLNPLKNGPKSSWDCRLPSTISTFETIIRYLGGLLSAYELAQDKLMLDRAIELGNWLLPALTTADGGPIGDYTLGHNPMGAETNGKLGEMGSLSMEFTRLSMLSGDETFYQAVQRTMDTLDTKFSTEEETDGARLGTLLPENLNSQFPTNLEGTYKMGRNADSYYEYLIKMYQLTGGQLPQYKRMYEDAIESAKQYLMRSVEVPGWNNITIIGEMNSAPGLKRWNPFLDHLVCFAGGMLGLASRLLDRQNDIELALNVTNSCTWLYEIFKSGVGSETIRLFEGDNPNAYKVVSAVINGTRELGITPAGTPPMVQAADLISSGQGGTIESVLYMYRLTGDQSWQDRGWKMFTSWVEASISDSGFAGISNIDLMDPPKTDVMQSFVLGETFKYYYLLFSPEDYFSVDDWVFNTGAHPFRVPKPDHQHKFASMWDGVEIPLARKQERGGGSHVQQWARIQHASADGV